MPKKVAGMPPLLHTHKQKRQLFLKISFWTTWVLFVGPLINLLWTSGDVFPGFQSQGGSPNLCASSPVCNRILRFTFGATPADILAASMAADPKKENLKNNSALETNPWLLMHINSWFRNGLKVTLTPLCNMIYSGGSRISCNFSHEIRKILFCREASAPCHPILYQSMKIFWPHKWLEPNDRKQSRQKTPHETFSHTSQQRTSSN